MLITCKRPDQAFSGSCYDEIANALLNGAREEDGGGSGKALRTTPNGACLFNAACTATFGGGCSKPSETNFLALHLRHAIIRHGIVNLEAKIKDKESDFRRTDAYDGNVIDLATKWNVDIHLESYCEGIYPEDIARALFVGALLGITGEFSEGSGFCLPLLADVTRLNFRCCYPGNNS